MEEAYFRDFKDVIDYEINEMNTQIHLSFEDINCPIRPDLGQNIDLVYMRLLRVALRDTFGSKLSNSILYESGKNLALHNIKVSTVDELLGYLKKLMIGITKVISISDNKIVLEEDECAVCSGMPNIGEPLCSFESGFIAGGLTSILKKEVSVVETACWGLGDNVCRFEATIFSNNEGKTNQNPDKKINTVDLMTTLASKASMAIALNKELRKKNNIYTKQMELAQSIQKKIIPTYDLFASRFIDFYSYLKPFRKIGGDFYDFYELRHDKVGIAVADITGHGIDAAMITGMVKLIMQHFKKVKGLLEKPSKIMNLIEKDIKDVLSDIFFSMIYMVIDPHKLSISYCNAGHPSAILFRKEQNVIQFLNSNHPLVGLSTYIPDDYGFTQNSVLYEKGDKLFLYTDGIPETRNPSGEFFNVNRILDIIRDSRDEDVSDICKSIIASVEHFRNTNDQDDDICLIGLQL